MTREELRTQREAIKLNNKKISQKRSKLQLNKAGFKAKVGLVELGRSLKSFFGALFIVARFLLRDFVAWLGKLTIKLADYIKRSGHHMDWNANDWNRKEAK